MRFASLASLVIAAFLGASLAAPPARANSAPPAGPILHPPGDVRAGECVDLAWSAPPPGARELEVLLSVDDGAHFTLRATAELDGALDHARWRVPNLPTAHARLRLRWSDGAMETLAPASAPFCIEGDPVQAAGAAIAPVADRGADATVWDEDDPATAGPLAGGLPGLTPDATLGEGVAAPGAEFTPPRPLSARAVEPRIAVRLVGRPAPPAACAAAPTSPPQRRAPLRE